MGKAATEETRDLTDIPGVGPKIRGYLWNLGVRSIQDLKGRNPEELYFQDGTIKGTLDDRCLLYVFRLAVYYVDHEDHDPEKLKWWYWKDQEYPLSDK